MTKARPTRRFAISPTSPKSRVDGIDVTQDEYVCQMDSLLNLVEPARRWATRDPSDPQNPRTLLVPGSLAVEYSFDFTGMSTTFVVFQPS